MQYISGALVFVFPYVQPSFCLSVCLFALNSFEWLYLYSHMSDYFIFGTWYLYSIIFDVTNLTLGSSLCARPWVNNLDFGNFTISKCGVGALLIDRSSLDTY